MHLPHYVVDVDFSNYKIAITDSILHKTIIHNFVFSQTDGCQTTDQFISIITSINNQFSIFHRANRTFGLTHPSLVVTVCLFNYLDTIPATRPFKYSVAQGFAKFSFDSISDDDICFRFYADDILMFSAFQDETLDTDLDYELNCAPFGSLVRRQQPTPVINVPDVLSHFDIASLAVQPKLLGTTKETLGPKLDPENCSECVQTISCTNIEGETAPESKSNPQSKKKSGKRHKHSDRNQNPSFKIEVWNPVELSSDISVVNGSTNVLPKGSINNVLPKDNFIEREPIKIQVPKKRIPVSRGTDLDSVSHRIFDRAKLPPLRVIMQVVGKPESSATERDISELSARKRTSFKPP